MASSNMGLVLNVFLGILLCLDFKLGGSKNQVQARPFRPRDASRVFHSLRPYRPGPPARNLEERPRYQPNEDKAWKFMKKYGYINDGVTDNEFRDKYRRGDMYNEICRVQRYMGLTPTGNLDDTTCEKMDSSRCGFPDKEISSHPTHGSTRRAKRYVLDGGRWEQSIVTYRVLDTSTKISISNSTSVIRMAFDVWQRHIPLVFQEVATGDADIYLSFKTLDHGDSFPFDGPGGTYAHAYGPQSEKSNLTGDVHFDDSEEFVLEGFDGINLFWVASHEIGHSLGLGHSDVFGSLMWPYYGQTKWNGNLNYDDKLGIQALYRDDSVMEILESSMSAQSSSSEVLSSSIKLSSSMSEAWEESSGYEPPPTSSVSRSSVTSPDASGSSSLSSVLPESTLESESEQTSHSSETRPSSEFEPSSSSSSLSSSSTSLSSSDLSSSASYSSLSSLLSLDLFDSSSNEYSSYSSYSSHDTYEESFSSYDSSGSSEFDLSESSSTDC
ncbi:matrix metalloproteinase 16 [Apostichopus japonicus]|uniref:Matrix metalloproteinase 16 n=1 Tax=Stichopus japonicus TaxID=307972 RepID=A0A2G8KQY2_STIJA|nr:matrix metalloproteinase 16 [Apostichopus japonicus]